MQRILVLISLFFSYNVLAALPITGSWQIVSYQIIGYPGMEEAERDSWLGNIIQFDQKIALNDGKISQICPEFTYKVTTENSEAQFLTGYNVKPHKLGITEETIQLIEITCNTDSWLVKPRWFAKISDIHILGYWDGVLFFMVKQVDTNLLLITPQSVGMVNSKSLFSQLVKSFPQYTFDTEENKFYQQNRLMLEVYPNNNRISHINIFDKNAIAPANAKIGMVYTDIFKNSAIFIDCEAGVRELVGKTICSFKDILTVKYVFEPTSGISPIEALENAKLIEFIWIANTSLMEEEKLPDLSIPEITPIVAVHITDSSIQVDNFTHLADIKSRINLLLEKISSQNKKFNTAILDLNNAQQTWMQYSSQHCQWSAIFLGISEADCMEKMAQERADEIEIILQELEQLPLVPMIQ